MSGLMITLLILVGLIIVVPLCMVAYLYYFDAKQPQHAVLRNYPLLGKVRYIFEKIGPEMRQYLFDDDNSGKPFSREDYKNVIIPAKYQNNMLSFGSKRDFDREGYFIRNAMFPKQSDELQVDNSGMIDTKKYKIEEDDLFKRKEHMEEAQSKPWLLTDENAVVIGENARHPFKVKGLVGMSAMSYGSLGDRAVTALSIGLGMATGTWMNTGEGGLSPYHLKGDVDIIMQIGPGLFGVRTPEGELDFNELKKKAELKQVKAIELKLAQGAKARGGHLDGSKVTPEIAEIRGVEPWKTVDSPNRFKEFHDLESMFDLIDKIREVSGLPVGIKMVVGHHNDVHHLANYMKETGRGPDFITVDGSEGGTGATYQELADSVGLPVKPAVMTLHQALKAHGVRDRVKVIASGKLFTPDRIAVVLGMGADLVNIARAFMFTAGCIMAQRCHTNTCPVGVATTDPKLQKALVIDEKKYRVANYVLTIREGLFTTAAAAGLTSPTEFTEENIAYQDEKGRILTLDQLYEGLKQPS
ncbi:glutamate synthase (ferredoxin) [Pullulanibacillus pueri]|uniref:Glutamate synthase large subunit-like protein YerD n=1 Tax=Pullulanibacillus pueri TaxID=1437324 RepID=A0A8J2ZUA5_9BACL|nr:FMN-binding glutamate synthase family protein [Pullulanibacillus pueri]MBM7680736.1 glutamate synthase (ferredoxin) [Pullulanibacillus pueri]GGH78138.1 glutamate synthase large subunit-like protein YerD [Pullulanibacillus pueri]